MKKILLLALPLMVMCFASCAKVDNVWVTDDYGWKESWTDDSPIIQFKDPKFLNALLNVFYSDGYYPAIPVDRNGDGQISEKEAAVTTEISEALVNAGIRDMSEIKYFTVERVKSGKIEIYNKGKYRRIFLPKVLQWKLLSYCHNNQIAEGWIFVTKNGKLKDRSNIWREMKRLKEKARVAESKIFPHNFRHLFARIWYEVTKDITGLADLLGHSSINVTRIYTATTETVFQKKLDKIVEQKILECTT